MVVMFFDVGVFFIAIFKKIMELKLKNMALVRNCCKLLWTLEIEERVNWFRALFKQHFTASESAEVGNKLRKFQGRNIIYIRLCEDLNLEI